MHWALGLTVTASLATRYVSQLLINLALYRDCLYDRVRARFRYRAV